MLHGGRSPQQAAEVEGLKPHNGEQEESVGVSHGTPACSLAWKHRESGVSHPDGFEGRPVRGVVSSSHRA